jgi:hypothetical protein
VNYRAALLRIVWKYQNYDEVNDDALRSRAFLTSFTAAAALYDASLKFVTKFERSPNAMRKLNEPEPLWNIPSDLYDTVRRNLADPENRKLLTRAQRKYANQRRDFERHDLLTRDLTIHSTPRLPARVPRWKARLSRRSKRAWRRR